tara:strand:- start:282 stop:1562 length:1281 start_codon:yes stop_codon:yes gene_type:complete
MFARFKAWVKDKWTRFLNFFSRARAPEQQPLLGEQAGQPPVESAKPVSRGTSTTSLIMTTSQPTAVERENQQANNWLMLGRDPIQHVAHLTPATKDVVSLASTCHFLHEKFQPVLDQRKLQTLAHYVLIEPNEVKVKNILAHSPELVDVIVPRIKDTAGRIHEGKTLSQLAYGAGDPEMCAVIKPSFISHYKSEEAGVAAMQKQINEAFGHEQAEEDIRHAYRLQLLLKPVIAAIDAEQFNLGQDANKKLLLSPATLSAIEIFRDELKNWLLSNEKGFHFRHHTLQETYSTYANLAAQWNYQFEKCKLFEDGVLSSILTYVPVNDAQKFSQGLYYLQEENEPCRRSLALRDGGKNFYEAVRKKSSVFALSGSCVDIIFGVSTSHDCRARSRAASGEGGFFQNLCRTKISNLQSLCNQPNHNRSLGV